MKKDESEVSEMELENYFTKKLLDLFFEILKVVIGAAVGFVMAYFLYSPDKIENKVLRGHWNIPDSNSSLIFNITGNKVGFEYSGTDGTDHIFQGEIIDGNVEGDMIRKKGEDLCDYKVFMTLLHEGSLKVNYSPLSDCSEKYPTDARIWIRN